MKCEEKEEPILTWIGEKIYFVAFAVEAKLFA
jgi:hypothetical protein